jgi:hypothetical protein
MCFAYSLVSLQWYEDMSGDRKCKENHEEMQLNQWSACLHMIEQYEQNQTAKFDTVVKLRPDDLWYIYIYMHIKVHFYIYSWK